MTDAKPVQLDCEDMPEIMNSEILKPDLLHCFRPSAPIDEH